MVTICTTCHKLCSFIVNIYSTHSHINLVKHSGNYSHIIPTNVTLQTLRFTESICFVYEQMNIIFLSAISRLVLKWEDIVFPVSLELIVYYSDTRIFHSSERYKPQNIDNYKHWILCLLDRALLWWLKNKRPTWCHLLFYLISYVLNMFRTLIYPSSGACDYSVELTHWSYCSWFDVCCSFVVVRLEWYPCCRLQFATRIPLQPNHTETPTHIEPRTIRPMW